MSRTQPQDVKTALEQCETLLKDYSFASSMLVSTGIDYASDRKGEAYRALLFLLFGDANTPAWLPAILSLAKEAAVHDDLPNPPELASLRRELTMHRNKARGDYWAWQGDGSDYPDSLSCPVLILAADIRKLLANQKPD